MLSLSKAVRIYLATQPIDGRKGADSLAAIVRSASEHDPMSGHLFVFFSRRCDCVRVLAWDDNGFALWSKRLERGRFRPTFREDGRLAISAVDRTTLLMLLEGVELSQARRRPAWTPTLAA
jgi:transposase